MYTGKGDTGSSTTLRSQNRIWKCDKIFEALGSVDELNAWIGLCRTKLSPGERVKHERIVDVLFNIQEQLFSIQAELAGADKAVDPHAVEYFESIINYIQESLPPVTSFLIPGGTETAAMLDYARTLTRRSERSLVEAYNENNNFIKPETLSFLNRLSSILYALTRWINYQAGIEEKAPRYKF